MIPIGLDNGFYVKSNKRKIIREMLPSIIKYPFDTEYGDNVEIVYWRKNWGLRHGVLDILGKRFFSSENEYRFEIDKPETVEEIIELIVMFLDPERWENDGQSIWTADEARPGLLQDIVNLAAIQVFMEENPDVYLEFYDSY